MTLAFALNNTGLGYTCWCKGTHKIWESGKFLVFLTCFNKICWVLAYIFFNTTHNKYDKN